MKMDFGTLSLLWGRLCERFRDLEGRLLVDVLPERVSLVPIRITDRD